jgi:hypothetical protein
LFNDAYSVENIQRQVVGRLVLSELERSLEGSRRCDGFVSRVRGKPLKPHVTIGGGKFPHKTSKCHAYFIPFGSEKYYTPKAHVFLSRA